MDNKDNDIYIELTATDSCNCSCSYCFEGCNHKGAVSNPEIEKQQIKFLEDYCKTFDTSKHKHLSIAFWGGEPFMNLPHMAAVIDATCKYDFVRYFCYSNGTLVDKYDEFLNMPFIQSIKDRLHVQLSYDGEPHNTIKRGYSNENILKVADKLKEAGIMFVFKATLSYDMVPHLVEIWKSYEELFYRYPEANVRYIPTIDTSFDAAREDLLDVWKEKVIEVAKLEYKFAKKNGFPLWEWFNDGMKMTCKIKNTCLIHTDGNLYVCHGVPYLDNAKKKSKLTLGNIYTSKLDEVLSKTRDSNVVPVSCLKCNATYCSVCHVVNLHEDDDLIEGWAIRRPADSIRCKYFKEFGYISRLLKYAFLTAK